MPGYLSADTICSEKRAFFFESVARGMDNRRDWIGNYRSHVSSIIYGASLKQTEWKIMIMNSYKNRQVQFIRYPVDS